MEEYKIEAKASVPYAMYIKANSDEEARNIAEEKAKSYENACFKHKIYINNEAGKIIDGSLDTLEEYIGGIDITEIDENTDYDSWSMRVDDYGLEIESVSRVCKMRPFIPGFDD